MEEKLFWVGIIVGIHFLLTRRFRDKNRFDRPAFARGWHAAFMALLAFVGGALVAVSLDNRSGASASPVLFSLRQLAWGFAGAVIFGCYAFFKGGKARHAAGAGLPSFIKDDLEWSETVFSAVLLASVVMYLFVQAFKIPSGSMRTTFLEGDHLFVNKFIYGFRVPYTHKKFWALRKIQRGDIVIFLFPSPNPDEYQCGGQQYGKDFIKRVVGLPGDKIEVKNGKVFVNGAPLDDAAYARYADNFRYPAEKTALPAKEYQRCWETRMLGKMFSEHIKDNFGPVTVPAAHYMMMGDNRDRSCDSRYWGPVPESFIKGKAMFIYWPPARAGVPR